MDELLNQLRREFLTEAGFYLQDCEESYLSLEFPEKRPEELNKIFRLAHSLKGAGASLGYDDLAQFAHLVEDLLTFLKTQPDKVNQEVITVLLESGDAFKVKLSLLEKELNGESVSSKWDTEKLKLKLIELRETLSGKVSPSVSSVSTQIPSENQNIPETKTEHPLSEREGLEKELQHSFDKPSSSSTETFPKNSFPDETEKSPNSKNSLFPVQTSEQCPQSPHSPQAAATSPSPPISSHASTIKVETPKIDAILDAIGELVILKSQLTEACRSHESDFKLHNLSLELERKVRELQDQSLSLRMTPLKSLFLKTQRVLRDLSVKLNKPIQLELIGENTEVDRTMVELLADPLLHIARNALDHGIEKSEDRITRNKPPVGKITLRAINRGSNIEVSLSDDGGGISKDKVFKKAFDNGLIGFDKDPAQLTDNEIFQFIFAAGFSTAEKVTDVSGRGVGMDVVKTNIEKMRGQIHIQSIEGSGSTFSITLPLTTAIQDGMRVKVLGNDFLIPINRVIEIIDSKNIKTVVTDKNKEEFYFRDKPTPIFHLSQYLLKDTIRSNFIKPAQYIVCETKTRPIAIGVEELLGQLQVVLKPIRSDTLAFPLISAAAVLSNGKIGYVLDVEDLEKFMQEERSLAA